MILLFLPIGLRLTRIDGDVMYIYNIIYNNSYMGEIKCWKDWFRDWKKDRFQLFSDVMVKSILLFIYFYCM